MSCSLSSSLTSVDTAVAVDVAVDDVAVDMKSLALGDAGFVIVIAPNQNLNQTNQQKKNSNTRTHDKPHQTDKKNSIPHTLHIRNPIWLLSVHTLIEINLHHNLFDLCAIYFID